MFVRRQRVIVGRSSKTVTIPSGLVVGDEVTLAASSRYILIDTAAGDGSKLAALLERLTR